MKNYLQEYLGQMQRDRATGATVAPRWSQTGDNQAWYDNEFAQKQVAADFDRSMRERELGILEGAFKMPERRPMQYQRTEIASQPFIPREAMASGYGYSRSGAQAPAELDNYLSGLLTNRRFGA